MELNLLPRLSRPEVRLGSAGVKVRVFGPRGYYPGKPFLSDDAVFLPFPDLVVTAVRQVRTYDWRERGTEIAWLSPEEIRLVGALLLSRREGDGRYVFCPAPRQHGHCLPEDIPLASERMVTKLREVGLAILDDHGARPPEFELREPPEDDPTAELFDGIDPDDELLSRGLYCLAKAGHLTHAHDGQFREEAAMNLHISIEAALEIIREHLYAETNTHPGVEAAYAYLREQFPYGDAIVERMRDLYELWITAKHPASRFGPHWSPPYNSEDILEPPDMLISIFRHIVLGEP